MKQVNLSIHHIPSITEVLNDMDQLKIIRKQVQNGDLYIVKNVVAPPLLQRIKRYLTNVGQSSLPNYQTIQAGAPNFHRINYWDERAYVQGCFHQFVFFPWNQDVFQLFERFKEVYYLKNLISNLPKTKFLGRTPEDGCTARLAFQFYPQGVGGLNKHIDPVDHHQLCVPIMILSKKGVDYEQGGLYVELKNGEKIVLDDIAEVGDVVLFNAQLVHGVDRIDPHLPEDWLSFKGRWMLLFATNKLFDNKAIANSVDLEE